MKMRLKSNRLDDAVWQGMGGDMIATHHADGRFAKVSEASASLFGLDHNALCGARLMDIVAPAHQPRLLAALAALADPEGPGSAKFECRVRFGETLGPHVEISLARTPDGGFRSITRNIEDRRREDASAVAHVNEMMAKSARQGEHLANFSHEIRTPLNAVMGFADVICEERFGPMGNDRYREYARVIHDTGQHLLDLIGDLLDWSKAESNEIQLNAAPTSVIALVKSCADIIRLQAEESGLFISVDVDMGLDQAMVDAKIVRQVVLNLLSNALKFTETGGITLKARREGEFLDFIVSDTGVGMSPDDLARVGERFAQAREEGVRGARGSGIGLALSKALARVHGGDLRLMSAERQGTTAVLRLPFTAVADPIPTVSNVTSLDDARRA